MENEEKELAEVRVYTGTNAAIVAMLLEKLREHDIPARLGAESASAGVFGVPEGSKTILVPKGFAKRAEEIIYVK
ncbi:MAG: hypothetical protein WD187_02365 [Candidatus Woykebacteria bacterium]